LGNFLEGEVSITTPAAHGNRLANARTLPIAEIVAEMKEREPREGALFEIRTCFQAPATDPAWFSCNFNVAGL
jgi:hypothetical protein